jgi:hypothetical protein
MPNKRFRSCFRSSLSLPKEDLEVYAHQTKISESRSSISECVSRGSTFQLFVAQIEYSRPWKVLPWKRILKGLQKVRPAFQNLRLGGVKCEQKMPSGFRSTFQGCEYSIWATNHCFVHPSKLFVWGAYSWPLQGYMQLQNVRCLTRVAVWTLVSKYTLLFL